MKRGLFLILLGAVLFGIAQQGSTSGLAYRLSGYATAGLDPILTIVVTDANGLGCLGVPLSISVTAGSGVVSHGSAVTEADGTTQVVVTGCSVGDTFNLFCGAVSLGKSTTITAAAARTVISTDKVVAWFGEASHTVYAAVIDPATNVMVTTNVGSIDDDDIDNNGDADTKRLTFAQTIMQDSLNPYRREVYQGTYDTGNIININVDDISGDPDATLSLSTLSTDRLLNGYATSGLNPQVVAVMIDRDGRGISGVTITARSSAGSMIPVSVLTNDNGVASFVQTGGALGNTITLTANLVETLPLCILTQDSQAISLTSQVFSWFERKTRRIHTAVTDRATHVLCQGLTDLRRDWDELISEGITPYTGNFTKQTVNRPGSSYVVYGGSEAGDLIRIYHYGIIHRYPGGPNYNSGLYGSSVITMPANENRYLMACAATGTDPRVWAMVTDGDGNAIKNVPITYTLNGPGSVASNTVTVWSGIAYNQIVGGALGNTLTVSSPGLGQVVIYQAPGIAPSLVDRVYGVYDSETHMVFGALVQSENNVMTTSFSQSQFTGALEADRSPGNNVTGSISSYFSPQNDAKLCQGYTGFGTVGAGDIFSLTSSYTAPGDDYYFRAAADAAEYLLAFATPGDRPKVWAVVMDNYGNGAANKPLTFLTTGGSLNAPTVTNPGGFAVAEAQSQIVYGNTITVMAQGLPPVIIWPAPGVNYASSDKAFMWFDPTTLLLRHACVGIENNVMTNNAALSATNLLVLDNSANDRLIGKGYVFDQSGTSIPPRVGTAFLTFGTPSLGDMVTANFGTSNTLESFIKIQRLNTLYLQAYAEYGSSPNIVAVVTDQNGNGLPGYEVSFSTNEGSLQAPPPGGFKTDNNGMVRVLYSQLAGWGEKITVTTSSFASAPIEIITYNQTEIQTYYKAVPFYNRHEHKVNVAFVHEYFNTMPYTATSIPIEDITAIDRTDNQKMISVSPLQNQKTNREAYTYLGFGTNAEWDQVSINDTSAEGSPDALITLKPDAEKYLFAFGTGGALPTTITAVVVDQFGNGLAGQEVLFTPSGGSLSLTHTVTDSTGSVRSVLYGSAPLGTSITISAPQSVSYTVVVQTANGAAVGSDSRVYPWYSVLEKTGHAAIVSQVNNILTSSSATAFLPLDMTPNGRSFALDTTTQQMGIYPAQAMVTMSTQGEGDRIIINETTTTTNPDAVLTISVPSSEIVSSLTASPSQVSTGQPITVRMPVFNNGSPAALTVTPSALNLAGNVSWVAGPTPGSWSEIPGGETREFQWVYTAPAAGDVIFTGQAFATDSFSLAPITSTATASNPVTVQTPPELACQWAVPDNAERLRDFTVTLTVSNAGQATAVSVTPVNVSWTGTAAASLKQGPLPASAVIPGNGQSVFAWVLTAGDGTGTLQMSGGAQGLDGNANTPVASASVESTAIEVIQGALNLERISSPDQEIYQGQKNLAVVMDVRNTSLLPVTLTAAALSFNGSPAGFTVLPAAGNPTWVAAQSLIQLGFNVAANSDAPLGHVVIDGTVSGDSEAGAMSAHGAPVTAAWTVLAPVNQLRQNYPNPLRLAQQAKTTFEYYLQTDEKATLKIYTLAGDVAAVLVDGSPGVGRHTVEWYGDNGSPGQRGKTVASGVYLAVLTIGEYKEIRKVVVVR